MPGCLMLFVLGLWTLLRALRFGSVAIALENLALRHQLEVLRRSVPRPRLSRSDRILSVWLSRLWTGWRHNLLIVQPATVLAWHRRGFRLYWRWRSRAPSGEGHPRLDPELRHLIQRMARENPTWGRRRIQAELALLGYTVAELTVAKYMQRTSPRASPTWRAFLATHARGDRRRGLLPRADPDISPACSSSSGFATTAANSSTSTSRIIPRPAGPRTRFIEAFPEEDRRRSTFSEIETRSTARSFTRCVDSDGNPAR